MKANVHDPNLADCQKHSFYAVGDDDVRCCAEMSCSHYINKHRNVQDTGTVMTMLDEEGKKL